MNGKGAAGAQPQHDGFTLIEVLIALAIAGLLMTAVYSTYMLQHKSYVIQDQVAAIQQNLRAAMYIMEIDLRMAGYDPSGRAGAGLTTAQSDQISFSYVADDDGRDNDGDDRTDERNELRTVRYRLYDAYGDKDTDLGRAVDGGRNQPVAENTDALDFVFYDGAGTEIDVGAGDEIDDIRVVEVTMVVRAYREDRDYTDNRIYTNRLGEEICRGEGDHFRRRILTKQIRGRNLGL